MQKHQERVLFYELLVKKKKKSCCAHSLPFKPKEKVYHSAFHQALK